MDATTDQTTDEVFVFMVVIMAAIAFQLFMMVMFCLYGESLSSDD